MQECKLQDVHLAYKLNKNKVAYQASTKKEQEQDLLDKLR